MHHGIYINIFPLDGLPDDKNEQIEIAEKIKKLIYYTSLKYLDDYKRGRKIYMPIKFLIRHLTPNSLYQSLANRIITTYDYDKSNYVGSLLSGYGEKAYYKKRIFDSYVMLPFGDREYSCPHQYDKNTTRAIRRL